jgi:hypothetical protein
MTRSGRGRAILAVFTLVNLGLLSQPQTIVLALAGSGVKPSGSLTPAAGQTVHRSRRSVLDCMFAGSEHASEAADQAAAPDAAGEQPDTACRALGTVGAGAAAIGQAMWDDNLARILVLVPLAYLWGRRARRRPERPSNQWGR